MKNIALFFLCVVMLATFACTKQEKILHDTQGKEIAFSSLQGKWVVLNVWASWCEGCVKEIPELNNFNQHITEHDLVFYGFNFDKLEGEDLKKAIVKANIHFPVLEDDVTHLWNLGVIDVLPATFIINPNGKLVKIILGPSTEKSLRQNLNVLRQAA
jgi:peroxiredoxin